MFGKPTILAPTPKQVILVIGMYLANVVAEPEIYDVPLSPTIKILSFFV